MTVIVEVKVNGGAISDSPIDQTLNYLKAPGRRLGLVINFGKCRLEYKRLIS